jgi:hypothetical protein
MCSGMIQFYKTGLKNEILPPVCVAEKWEKGAQYGHTLQCLNRNKTHHEILMLTAISVVLNALCAILQIYILQMQNQLCNLEASAF